MVNGIDRNSAGRAALEAALERMRAKTSSVGESVQRTEESSPFKQALATTVQKADATIERTEGLHLEVLQGKLDIHEVAAQLKESELSFQFALTVRNKLIDAYREVMRMTV